MNSHDVNGETGQWTESDARIWAAHRAKDEEPVLAYVLPSEIDLIVTDYLSLLNDLGGFQPGTATDAEMKIRSFALSQLQGYVEAGLVSTRKVNIMSRLLIGEDLFPTDDEDTLRIADLDFDVEDYVND